MTDFLIKSTLAMGVLLGLYYILFEREKMHRFNRFYLLSALVFSLALPFIIVITYIQEIPTSNQTITINSAPATFQPVTEQPIDYLFYIGWSLYIIITLALTIRFTRNVISFFRKANSNPSMMMEKAKLILLEEKVLPHTFLNYIFVNREEHEAKLIEDELYTHEYTHVKQKHTLDILFIEALKTLFWFNPLLYFYKKAIQLNHEFLADEKVIDTTANTVYYQKLLLEKANVGATFSMASNLTFSLTKKRFIMMTKTTSATKAVFIKLAIAPVVTALLMLLCTETVAQVSTKSTTPTPSRINVETVTAKELDSLQKADPAKYKGSRNDILKTTMTEVDEKGKHKDTVSFDKRPELVYEKDQFSAISKIDSDKIKGIEILQLTEFEKNTLNKLDPEKYNNSTFPDYMAVKVTFINDKGQPEGIMTYEKRPKHE